MTATQATVPNGRGAPSSAVRPMFYREPEVLEANRHQGLGLAPLDGFGFAREANAIPLNITEFAMAGVWYPIVFSATDRLTPLAVVGLRRKQNLFVQQDGAWMPGAYVPAYVRRYPFILTRPEGKGDQVLLCVDRAADRVVKGAAAPFFKDGEATEHTKNALEFCLGYQRQAMATERVAKALSDAGLLTEQQGNIELPSGEKLRFTDFLIVDEKALNALPDDKFMELRKLGALTVAYCQMMSMNSWRRMSQMAADRPE